MEADALVILGSLPFLDRAWVFLFGCRFGAVAGWGMILRLGPARLGLWEDVWVGSLLKDGKWKMKSEEWKMKNCK